MARKPFFRKACNAWYIVVRGKQVRLHEDRSKAFMKWVKLVSEGDGPQGADRTVGDVISDFLDWTKANREPSTYGWYSDFLLSFIESVEPLKVRDLKPLHVTKWLSAKGWKGTTANGAVRCVLRSMNWAVKQGHLDKNPITGIERPAATSRECYITPEQWKAAIANAKGPFRVFLDFARATGARPQEIRAIEKRHFDPALRAIVFPRDESKGKKHARVITLSPAALATIENLAERHPTGPLFRNVDDNPWTNYGITCAFQRLTRKVGFRIFAYAIRHTWATDALIAGVDPVTVANLMGHRDLKMLMSVYAKVQVRSDHMQAAVLKATGEVASQPA